MYKELNEKYLRQAHRKAKDVSWALTYPDNDKFKNDLKHHRSKTRIEVVDELYEKLVDTSVEKVGVDIAKDRQKILDDLYRIYEIFDDITVIGLIQFATEHIIAAECRFADVPSLIYYFMKSDLEFPDNTDLQANKCEAPALRNVLGQLEDLIEKLTTPNG